VNARQQIGGSHVERRREIYGGAAAETVAAAGKSPVMPILMPGLGVPVMVGMLLRAGLGVSDVQMKRSMGITVRKRERQQQDQAAQERGAFHGTIMYLRKGGKVRNPDSTRLSEGEAEPQISGRFNGAVPAASLRSGPGFRE
jgi:hypothetical protein